MTTSSYKGILESSEMLNCSLQSTGVYPSLVLALRDMREVNGRDPVTGTGQGNGSWVGLSIGMTILDTLSGDSRNDVRGRWERFLTSHGISKKDAHVIYMLRNSLLHGYGVPKPSEIYKRRLLLTDDATAFAVDTRQDSLVNVSVPVFCGNLVECISAQSPQGWDTSLIDTNYTYSDVKAD